MADQALIGAFNGANQNLSAIAKALSNIFVGNTSIGTFTCAASATTTVTDTNVKSGSAIVLVPTNAAAGTLQGSSKALYIVAANGSFAAKTASAAAAAGTETFTYLVATIG